MKISWLRSRSLLMESILAFVTGSFTLLAVVWPDWLESFGMHWDSGDGALEWAIPIAMALAALVFGVRAGRRWHIEFSRVVRARI